MPDVDSIDSDEVLDGGAPDYAYLAFEGVGKSITYDKKVKNDKGEEEHVGRQEGVTRQIYYLRVTGEDALEQAKHARENKGFAVIGYGNLETLKPEMQKVLRPQLEKLVNSPEAARAARLAGSSAPKSKKGGKKDAVVVEPEQTV